MSVSGGPAGIVQGQDIRQQPRGMEPVGQRKGADPCHNKPEGINRLAAGEGKNSKRGKKQ